MKTAVKILFAAALLAPGGSPPLSAAGPGRPRVSTDDRSYSEKTDALDLVSQGDANFQSEEFASAIKFWENAKRLDPSLAPSLNKNLGMAYAGYGVFLSDNGQPCPARDAFARALALRWSQGNAEGKIKLEAADEDCRSLGKVAPPVRLSAGGVAPTRILTRGQKRTRLSAFGGLPTAQAPTYTPQPAPVRSSPFALAQPRNPAPNDALELVKKKLLFMALSVPPLLFIVYSRLFQGMTWNQIAGLTSLLLIIGWIVGSEFLALACWVLAGAMWLKRYWDINFGRNRIILRAREAELAAAPKPAPPPAPKPELSLSPRPAPRPFAPAPSPAQPFQRSAARVEILAPPPEFPSFVPAAQASGAPPASQPSRPTLGKVASLMEQGKYKKALEAFVVKDPRQLNEADRVNLFEIHLHLGNFDRASGLFDQIQGTQPLKANISRYKSLAALAYEKKQAELARKVSRGLFAALKETRSLDENGAGLYYGFARSCEDNGDFDLARDIYRALMDGGLEGHKDVFARYENLKVKSAPPPPPPAAQAPPPRAPARPQLPPGAHMLAGRYELRRGIGEGGMGTVYEGWDREISRKVAVKKMHAWLKTSEQEYERFRVEARIVGRLRHPNIVGVHSIIEQDDEIYLIFDFVDGRTLAEILRVKKRFPIDECREIFSGVCAAVHYAHKNNVIHRDLKPANIMLDQSGYAYVMDFGLASELKESLSRVTHQTTSGTPAYMAPEQHEGIVKREADIYAMGVCLYEMLTGELPFRGQDPLKLKRMKDYREVTAMLPWLPSGVDDLLSHALEPEPSQRTPDALDFLEALKKL